MVADHVFRVVRQDDCKGAKDKIQITVVRQNCNYAKRRKGQKYDRQLGGFGVRGHPVYPLKLDTKASGDAHLIVSGMDGPPALMRFFVMC
jgi:hypothetical protein